MTPERTVELRLFLSEESLLKKAWYKATTIPAVGKEPYGFVLWVKTKKEGPLFLMEPIEKKKKIDICAIRELQGASHKDKEKRKKDDLV